jgi:hypothetical protein
VVAVSCILYVIVCSYYRIASLDAMCTVYVKLNKRAGRPAPILTAGAASRRLARLQ